MCRAGNALRGGAFNISPYNCMRCGTVSGRVGSGDTLHRTRALIEQTTMARWARSNAACRRSVSLTSAG